MSLIVPPMSYPASAYLRNCIAARFHQRVHLPTHQPTGLPTLDVFLPYLHPTVLQGLCSIGGGVQTFAFRPVFSPASLLRLPSSSLPAPATPSPPAPLPPPTQKPRQSSATPDAPDVEGKVPCLLVRTKDTATVKRALATCGMLDKVRLSG